MTTNPHSHAQANPHQQAHTKRNHGAQARRQFVAGFVIFRRTYEGVKFLLLYRRGSYWNFPKGHFNQGESALEAALREVEEETGLKKSDLKIIPEFRAYERFYFQTGGESIHDTVILHLAGTHKAEVRISPREHSGFGWFLYEDAVKTVGKKYHGIKRILKQAHDFLGARSRKYHHGVAHS